MFTEGSVSIEQCLAVVSVTKERPFSRRLLNRTKEKNPKLFDGLCVVWRKQISRDESNVRDLESIDRRRPRRSTLAHPF